jgi:hypothetical protein
LLEEEVRKRRHQVLALDAIRRMSIAWALPTIVSIWNETMVHVVESRTNIVHRPCIGALQNITFRTLDQILNQVTPEGEEGLNNGDITVFRVNGPE